jgi:DNA-binding response OmpR family regulator
MKTVCATCERPFVADDVLERDGLTFIFGVGIEYKGAKLKLPRAEHRILRQLMTRRFVAHETLIAEICREETENTKGSLKVRICKLRKCLKLVDAPFEIMNSPGMGYSLVRHVT